MTVEELSTIVMGELGWINFVSIFTVVILIAAVILLIYRINNLEEQLCVMEAKIRQIQRTLK